MHFAAWSLVVGLMPITLALSSGKLCRMELNRIANGQA
jgi:hypothetical protein